MSSPQSQLLGSKVGFGWGRWSSLPKKCPGNYQGASRRWGLESHLFPQCSQGQRLQWGAGEVEKWIKVPHHPSQDSPRLFQPFMDTDPEQSPALPCVCQSCWGEQDSACSAYPRLRCILIWINKSLRCYKTLPGSWVQTAHIYFLFFFPYQRDFPTQLLCCLI